LLACGKRREEERRGEERLESRPDQHSPAGWLIEALGEVTRLISAGQTRQTDRQVYKV
jgi:hypothetical protein